MGQSGFVHFVACFALALCAGPWGGVLQWVFEYWYLVRGLKCTQRQTARGERRLVPHLRLRCESPQTQKHLWLLDMHADLSKCADFSCHCNYASHHYCSQSAMHRNQRSSRSSEFSHKSLQLSYSPSNDELPDLLDSQAFGCARRVFYTHSHSMLGKLRRAQRFGKHVRYHVGRRSTGRPPLLL